MSSNPIYIPYAGHMLLESPLLNKASGFTPQERAEFNLDGLLPSIVETIEEQVGRAYEQLTSFETPIDKHIFLRNIQDTNETLFYRLVVEHLEEIMPLIYTPTVGEACQNFSHIYRRARGLFISYEDRHRIDEILHNATKQNVRVIVVTDGERILGLGDQGIGGMGISIGKLSLYVACGGISPANTLPVVLDCGCNNEELLNDPMYMGWRHKRIDGEQYDEFIDLFIQAVKRRYPDAILQFEDFANKNAYRLLEKYRDELCSFNDDIQGTASVTVATLIAAAHAKGEKLSDQRVVIVGGGSAGCGIAESIIQKMVREGSSEEAARRRIFLVGRHGLFLQSMDGMTDGQQKLAYPNELVADWSSSEVLHSVVENSKATVLVGVTGKPGLFDELLINIMQRNTDQPIVFPLSNPTSHMEGVPADILKWTNGKAIIATGSPIKPIELNGEVYPIAQCNNSYIFPGLGLGVLASKSTRISDSMLMAAAEELARQSPRVKDGVGPLLPPLSNIRKISHAIAYAVYTQAIEDGYAKLRDPEEMDARIERFWWHPEYRAYKRVSF